MDEVVDLQKLIPDHNVELFSAIPDHTQGSLTRYIVNRIEPGGFLLAVLENDLHGAMARADQTNRRKIFEICQYLYNCAPSTCYGNAEKVKNWLSRATQ